jgi:hydroxymethylpyrimidine pyrophosphatase-like HAD family hydrolase
MTERENKAFVFDLDGTLFETTAIPHYTNQPSPPNFIEFRDAKKLLEESTPLPLLTLAKEVYDEGHPVYILTARGGPMAPVIKKLLSRYGIKAEYVYTAGDRGYDIPAYKAEILAQLAKESKIYFWDDNEDNLIMVPSSIRTFLA